GLGSCSRSAEVSERRANSKQLIFELGFEDRGPKMIVHKSKFQMCAIGMSAKGQKQTCAVQKGMSALPPIATSIAVFGMSALGQNRTFGQARITPAPQIRRRTQPRAAE